MAAFSWRATTPERLWQGVWQIDFEIYLTIVMRALRGGPSDDFKHKQEALHG